jgi:hypothetical protein
MALPPRPEKRLAPAALPSELDVEVSSTMPPPARAPAPPLAELDEATRERINRIIARAIASELGSVRISSVPPPGDDEVEQDEPPRSSMRVAARGAGKVGKYGVFASGVVSLIGSAIALWRPEYAAPLGQALKLIAGVITALAGGGAPVAE